MKITKNLVAIIFHIYTHIGERFDYAMVCKKEDVDNTIATFTRGCNEYEGYDIIDAEFVE